MHEILPGLTGRTAGEVISKIKECEKLNIKRATLFFEFLSIADRKKVFSYLEQSSVSDFPMVHIRNDMAKDELAFLIKKYKSSFLTIHESAFKYLQKWKGFWKYLFLEMNYDNHVRSFVKVKKIGGFCIDLSHFKSAEEKWSRDFEYIISRRKKPIFSCNHLNGYSYAKNRDLHTIRGLKDFQYLLTLPMFLFGSVIGIETFNPITEQLKFILHIKTLLKSKIRFF